jgi:hypothetical protein
MMIFWADVIAAYLAATASATAGNTRIKSM